MDRVNEKRFTATILALGKTHAALPLPFDPAEAWGERERFHVHGTIDDHTVRGPLEKRSSGYVLPLGPACRRDTGLAPGDSVTVVLRVEGPQREGLAEDLRAALDAEPEAARFFDALASFYRKGYLRWVDATKRSPETRARRIAELVRLLKASRKQRD